MPRLSRRLCKARVTAPIPFNNICACLLPAPLQICTYVVRGRLTHKDSMGTSETLGRGAVQFMSAGKGVVHSEHNLNKELPLRIVQMWWVAVIFTVAGSCAGGGRWLLLCIVQMWWVAVAATGQGGAEEVVGG